MPELGKVKTRIAAESSPQKALEIYEQLVLKSRALIEALPEHIEIEVTFADPFDFVKGQSYFGSRPFLSQQAEGDLGQRMCVAAIRAFQSGASRVVLIGSDCPELTIEHVSQAFRILQDVPVVFGPATDGGYYLLGMSRVIPELFGNLPWSTDRLFAETQERLDRAGIPYGMLEELTDIDTLDDWRRCAG